MFFVYRLSSIFCALVLLALGTAAAPAQWLVYELGFTPEAESVNFSFYSGGYVVVPAEGGPASIVLTTEEGGRFYAVAESSGKFFVAANAQVRKAVFAASATSGTSQAFYTATGELNRSLLLNGGGQPPRSWRVAEILNGRLMAADDESMTGPAADGSLGVVGAALMTATLREDLTANASNAFASQNAATAYLVELLEKYGYAPDEGSLPPPEISEEDAATIDASLFPVETHGQAPAND